MARRRTSRRAWSRRQRAVLIGISLIGTALLVVLDRAVVAPNWPGAPTGRQQTLADDQARYDGRTFSVVRVVDGDTLHLGAADGTDETTKVRLIGVDAPEMGSDTGQRMYYADEATAFARQSALGRQVTLYLDQRAGSRDRYQRLLAYIQLPDGKFLNEELLSEGFAYADVRFKHGYFQRYRQLEAGARALDKGLWAHVRPEQMPAWRQKKQTEGTGDSD
ncbi:MAG: thermonuclease family protein [Phycisphaerae bacterium]|nr:thermonuclease family protein [Phycisphaerae bacterium]